LPSTRHQIFLRSDLPAARHPISDQYTIANLLAGTPQAKRECGIVKLVRLRPRAVRVNLALALLLLGALVAALRRFAILPG
jgi:hypothetical protein